MFMISFSNIYLSLEKFCKNVKIIKRKKTKKNYQYQCRAYLNSTFI